MISKVTPQGNMENQPLESRMTLPKAVSLGAYDIIMMVHTNFSHRKISGGGLQSYTNEYLGNLSENRREFLEDHFRIGRLFSSFAHPTTYLALGFAAHNLTDLNGLSVLGVPLITNLADYLKIEWGKFLDRCDYDNYGE